MKKILVEDRDSLEKLVRRAGERLLHYWPRAVKKDSAAKKEELSISTKNDGTFVTCADLESNEILIDGLSKLFPVDGIYSEERLTDEKIKSAEYVWIIDPLDGTKSFIDGNDDFSILLARCYQKIIDFGILYCPARQLYAFAERGSGALLNGKKMQVSDSKELKSKRIYLRHVDAVPQECIYDKWLDSGMAFLNLCRGELDGIVMKLVHHQEWDLAAAAILIEESGGKVTDEEGKPFLFNKAPVKSKYLIASNGIIHNRLFDFM